jgi:hypothetical protein
MTINGRNVKVVFSNRPPRIVAQRSKLGLPALWPGKIEAVSGTRMHIVFEHSAIIRGKDGEELGRRYVHKNFELLIYFNIFKYITNMPLKLEVVNHAS